MIPIEYFSYIASFLTEESMQVLSAAGHGSDHIVGRGVEDLSEAR